MACIFDRIHHTKSMEAKEKESPMVETFGNYSIETIYRVYNDKSGEYIEVGPDADGIGLIEVRMYTDDGKIGQRVEVFLGFFCLAELANFKQIKKLIFI